MNIRTYFKEERGAVLLLTAFALPLILACTGLAVDTGNVYLQKQRLQNAADAAVLSGTYMKADGKSQADSVTAVEDSLRGNYQVSTLITNIAKGTSASDASTLAYESHDETYTVNGTSADGMRVVLHQQVPTYFMKFFGDRFKTLDVNATSKAVVDSEGEDDSSEGYFDYVIFGARKTYDQQKSDDNAVCFRSSDVKINGNVGTNGLIAQNEKGYAVVEASKDSSKPNKVVGNVDYKDLGLYATTHGGSPDDYALTSNGVKNYVEKYETPMDISLDEKNSATSDIRKYIASFKAMSASERKEKGVYYDDYVNPGWKKGESYQFNANYDGDRKYLGVEANGARYDTVNNGSNEINGHKRNNFRVIIVDGDIEMNTPEHFDMPTSGDDNYAVIISLHGDIRIHNYSNFRGIVYAPSGYIWLDCYAPASGNFIGDRVWASNHDNSFYKDQAITYSKTDKHFHMKKAKKARLIN